MKKPSKWIRINGTYMGLNEQNILIGYIRDVKPIIRPPDRMIERFERVGR